MCGIVGAVAQRPVAPILIEGLRRLEYRGYDSAGLAVLKDSEVTRVRAVGKVQALADKSAASLNGNLGVAHTRWATHGEPLEKNAHPHMSGSVAVVHNGIVENFEELKAELIGLGYVFESDTDTEVIAHLIDHELKAGSRLINAVAACYPKLKGAFALGVVSALEPNTLVAVRSGSPLVIGLGLGENFIASDQLALLPVTNRFIYLEEGDIAQISRDQVQIFENQQPVNRAVHELDATLQSADKGEHKHYMHKEIFEQPEALARLISTSFEGSHFSKDFLTGSQDALAGLKDVQHIQILACGTSFYAGLTAKYWFEELAQISCSVEIASEFRYRKVVVPNNTLLVLISQSGETADTLSALRALQTSHTSLTSLALCNVPTSSMVRETDLFLFTNAGPEVGVASTKAFSAQLTALYCLCLKMSLSQNTLTDNQLSSHLDQLRALPAAMQKLLKLEDQIHRMALDFEHHQHCLFLGRGSFYPIALEGALKLKEISYIHAEGYAAGELKHGPLALVDHSMPVVVLAPNNPMLGKLKANVQEVQARGGQLYVFADPKAALTESETLRVVELETNLNPHLDAVLYVVPVQLLAYHVAVIRGTDVDQPRNLAKSVTVE